MNFLKALFGVANINPTFAFRKANGRVAEWLGRGLQNLVQRFESARNLSLNCGHFPQILDTIKSLKNTIWTPLLKRAPNGIFFASWLKISLYEFCNRR